MHKPEVKTTKLSRTTATTDGLQQLDASFFYTQRYKTNSWAHKLKGYRENDIWCSTENAEVDDAMCHNQSLFFYWISKLFTIKQWLATAMCYAVQYILQDYISKYTKTVVGNKQFCQTRMAGYTGYKFVAGNWKQSTIYTLQYCTNINEHVISTAY